MARLNSNEAVRDLAARLALLPSVDLIQRPTPIHGLSRLTELINGPRILVKREDLSGLALGGNKARELEYFLGAASAAGADVFIAGGGGPQSNHATQCAAAARKLGMTPVIVLWKDEDEPPVRGNLLLTEMFGADIRFVARASVFDSDDRSGLSDEMENVASEYRSRGARPWILPSSFHPLGAVGFIDCALEIHQQLRDASLSIDYLYVASQGATQVGLVCGMKILEPSLRVVGVNYSVSNDKLVPAMVRLGNAASRTLNIPDTIESADIRNLTSGDTGYGISTNESRAASALLAKIEGLLLDPVYTAKAMARLISDIEAGGIGRNQTVLFLHTGGLGGIFGHGLSQITI